VKSLVRADDLTACPSAYKVKNNYFLASFLFGISFFVLEESDDVIGGSTKTAQ